MSRPFAAFDIDGTLIRWQLYHAVADELARQGLLNETEYQAVRDARMTWKKRTGPRSFDDYERVLVQAVDKAIATIPVAKAELAYRAVLDEYKDQVYTYTRDLLRQLKAKDYLLFAISGSQAEIIKLLAKHYGFDNYGGTVYEVKGQTFTGTSQVLRSHRKPEYLKQLVKKHGASWQGSVGVGDSESDIPMLSEVERPIAFNPTRELFEHAQAKGWQVIVERKNMIYRLEPSASGSYELRT